MSDLISLANLRTDGGAQSRACLNEDVVQEYMEAYQMGADLGPVVAFHDGTDTCLADGFHRVTAAIRAGLDQIAVEIRPGTLRDAILYSCGANATHGQRRTNEDKRHAVAMLLADEEWGQASDRWVADQCHVSDHLVADVRKVSTARMRSSNGRTGKDGKTRSAPTLCKRCQRVGKVKNCAACKDLQMKKPPKKKTKKPPEKVSDLVDDFGNPIPDQLKDAWADPWIAQTLESLEGISETVREERFADGLKKRQKAYPFFKLADFRDACGFVMDYLDHMIKHLRENRPAGVCPTCAGMGCPDCHQKGLVPTTQYKELKKKKGAS